MARKILSSTIADWLQFTMQIIAEKRGLNYYTSKDNFYSIKIKLETLVIRAKIRLKAQF